MHPGQFSEYADLIDAVRALCPTVNFLQGDDIGLQIVDDGRQTLVVETTVRALTVMDVVGEYAKPRPVGGCSCLGCQRLRGNGAGDAGERSDCQQGSQRQREVVCGLETPRSWIRIRASRPSERQPAS
jgi:hypothetical protein